MAARKGIIQLSRGDIAVSAKFETERMEEHELEEAPEIFMWDASDTRRRPTRR